MIKFAMKIQPTDLMQWIKHVHDYETMMHSGKNLNVKKSPISSIEEIFPMRQVYPEYQVHEVEVPEPQSWTLEEEPQIDLVP